MMVVYYQTDGVAMGNSLEPILAKIFMAHLEETKIVDDTSYPKFYRRYVDDTFCLFNKKEDANNFFEHINKLHPSIRFEMEVEQDSKLSFLDTVITRVQGSSSPLTSSKVKTTDKRLFYNFDSFIPIRYKI